MRAKPIFIGNLLIGAGLLAASTKMTAVHVNVAWIALACGAVVGTIILTNASPGAGVTDGTGGQGVKPLPITTSAVAV